MISGMPTYNLTAVDYLKTVYPNADYKQICSHVYEEAADLHLAW